MSAYQINLRIVRYDLHYIIKGFRWLAVFRDLDAAVIFFRLEFRIQIDQFLPLSIYITSFHTGLVFG